MQLLPWICYSWAPGHGPGSSKKPQMRPATLAGSVSHGAVLQLNNSALCSGSGPAERAAPLENANEAEAAEQQPQFAPRKPKI